MFFFGYPESSTGNQTRATKRIRRFKSIRSRLEEKYETKKKKSLPQWFHYINRFNHNCVAEFDSSAFDLIRGMSIRRKGGGCWELPIFVYMVFVCVCVWLGRTDSISLNTNYTSLRSVDKQTTTANLPLPCHWSLLPSVFCSTPHFSMTNRCSHQLNHLRHTFTRWP